MDPPAEDLPDDDDLFTVDEHSIPEVKKFVEENPELAEDVLAVERGGRARKGLLDWLPLHIASIQA